MDHPPQISPSSPRAGIDDCWNRIGIHGDASCPELERHVHCRNCPVYSAAAATLLDGDLPPGHLAGWTRHFSQARETQAADTHSVIIFRLGAEWLALPTNVFKEVATQRPLHTLPHRTGGAVLGLVNVRGELLVCVDLARVLGLARAAHAGEDSAARPPRLIVVSREGSRLVFPVDEVHGIQRFNPADRKEAPATVARATATYAKTVLPWRDRSVGCLDDQLLFYTLNRSLA